jgi:HlyD family secretion protein
MIDQIKRWRWAIGIGALLLLGLIYSFWPAAVPVDVDSVTRGEMIVGVTDDGITRLDDLYVVSAPVTGYVTRIEIEAGDQVIANDTVIARMAGRPSTPLDNRTRLELRTSLAAARAAERSAAATLTLSSRELARAEELMERGFLPQSRLDAARADTETRRAEVQRSRAEAGRIRAALNEPGAGRPSGNGPVVVRSPSSGVVLRVVHESEGVIAEGAPLVEVGDAGRIEVVVDLLSREAVRVQPGAEVLIERWGGDRPLRGRVRTVEPFGVLRISALGIEEQRVNVIIDFEETEADVGRLGHGFQIDATIVLWQAEDALRVPIGAIFRSGEAWHVYALSGSRAVERAIEVGHINDDFAEVLGGLEEGDRVIVNPSNSVADGRRITAR